MSICKVSMEIVLVLPAKCWGNASSPAGMCCIFLEVSPGKSKALKMHPTLHSVCYLEGNQRNWVTNVNLTFNIHCILDTNSENSIQSESKYKDKLSQAYQGTLPVVSRTIL